MIRKIFARRQACPPPDSPLPLPLPPARAPAPYDGDEPEMPAPEGTDWTLTRGVLPGGLGPRTFVKAGDPEAQRRFLELNIRANGGRR